MKVIDVPEPVINRTPVALTFNVVDEDEQSLEPSPNTFTPPQNGIIQTLVFLHG
jgi:hypothetical protein